MKFKDGKGKGMGRLFMIVTCLMALGAPGYAANPAGEAPMDPVMMEKMEQMKMLTAPSEAHKVLEPFAGKWTYTGQFWMTPESPAEAMSGTAEHTLVYGGRFLKQEFEGPWMGETFQGLGYTGYDNIRQEYVSTWLDSMSTSIMTVTGQYDASTQTLEQSGANSCPLTGEKARHSRSEWTVVDPNHTKYTSYMNGPDGGAEYKMMEITYTRILP